MTGFKTLSRRLLPLVFVLALAGCKTVLYSNLTEQEANQMLSVLLAEGIDSNKIQVDDGLFSVSVQNAELQSALDVLESQGLPRRGRESIGQVFAKSGIVSSPFEERVRFVYALGEEVAGTLQEIDGVMVARVHIVMPEDPGLGRDAKPSSAAVFLKQKPGYDLDFLMPQVRRLVSNSIEGVEYDNVTVILVDTQAPPTREARMNTEFSEPIPGIKVEADAVNRFTMYAIGAAAIVGLLALLSAFLTWRVMVMRKRVALATDGEDDN